jgi:hypothetical protein
LLVLRYIKKEKHMAQNHQDVCSFTFSDGHLSFIAACW